MYEVEIHGNVKHVFHRRIRITLFHLLAVFQEFPAKRIVSILQELIFIDILRTNAWVRNSFILRNVQCIHLYFMPGAKSNSSLIHVFFVDVKS